MASTARTYMIFTLSFASAFVLMLFTGPLFQRPSQPCLIRESLIPDSPHSHGEFDDMARRIGRMKAKNWMDSSEHSHAGEDEMARTLYSRVRVLCWIMTGPPNHKTKAVHVKATWAKRCNKYIFVSSKDDPSLPAIDIKVSEGREHLWGKTKAAFRYLYDHHLNDFDFFLKADDDTYVVLENLRYMLRNVKPTEPILFGRKFKPFVKQGYMSGGAGYVVSREGLRLMVEKGFGKHKNCRKDEGGAEDVHFGECAQAVGVLAGDSRDSLGRERFHPFPPDAHFRPIDKGNWLWSYNFYPLKTGPECCSDTSVAYHYIAPDWMYILEYFVYHWHPYGVVRDWSAVQRYLRSHEKEGNLHQSLNKAHEDEMIAERQAIEADRKKVLKLRLEAEQLRANASRELKAAEATHKLAKDEVKKVKELNNIQKSLTSGDTKNELKKSDKTEKER